MTPDTNDRKRLSPSLALALSLVAALGLGGTTVALAQALNLPAKLTFKQGKDSPGPVTFSHWSHVDQKKPDCTVCHPKHFKILEPGMPADGPRITHEAMKRGRQCGACHNDEITFGLEDCSSCHEKR